MVISNLGLIIIIVYDIASDIGESYASSQRSLLLGTCFVSARLISWCVRCSIG